MKDIKRIYEKKTPPPSSIQMTQENTCIGLSQIFDKVWRRIHIATNVYACGVY